MLDLEDRLDELNQLGLHQRMRMVSGPQGPRVVLEGQPVLLMCSGNALGLADHPRVRQAAADAAMRWGVGAGAARVSCGTMTLHRRLEERLAAFTGRRAALLFGSGALANLGVIPALARRGEVVLYDELSHSSIVDGCRLSGADVVAYRHADAEHLAWALRQCDGRATLIATDGMFGMDGDVAPLADIAALARRHDTRVLVDEAHALGALGPGGRGAVAEAEVEDEIHIVTGTLGKALGSYGGFVACDHVTARFLVHSARTLLHSTALPPVAAAAAMAALDLLESEPRRVEKLRANAETLRDGLAREGFDVSGAAAHVVPLVVGDAELACRMVDHALEQGVFAEAIRPPAVPEGTARVRLSVMASHTRPELRQAATVLARAAIRSGFRPGAGLPVAAAQGLLRGVKLFPMLSCADLERSLALYRDLLGGVESYRFESYVGLSVGDSEIGLGGMAGPPIHGRPQRPATGHRIELCVYVDDVDATFTQAGDQGFEQVVSPADMPWGERVAWIADPDGNLLMLAR